VVEYRVRILRRAEMTDLTLDVEVAPGEPAGEGGVPELSRRIVKAFEAGLLFRPGVVIVPPGTLPRFELKARRWFVEGGRDRGGR
jgi:phenylacetate-CoA ligase